MSISARDQARIGRVLSPEWIAAVRQPCAIVPYDGYLIWLNHEGRVFPSVSASSFFGVGAGSLFTRVEPERKLVAVVRWLDSAHADALFGRRPGGGGRPAGLTRRRCAVGGVPVRRGDFQRRAGRFLATCPFTRRAAGAPASLRFLSRHSCAPRAPTKDFAMNYRRLGSSNLRVSPLCLGTMMFGEQTPDDEAARIVASARDHGLNFIDTADVYNEGRSEEVVGKLLQGQRHDWVLASKIGNVVGKGPNQSHYSRQWLIRGVEQSLARLGTDFLDILYLHRDYHEEHLEEALWTLGDLIRAGKLRSFGLSNFRGWRIAETLRLCEKLGVPQPVVCQPYYNLLNRGPEVEILPACKHYGLGVVPYSPIARGVLTGKYLPGQAPAADTRAGRGDRRILATEFREESLQIAQRLVEHSADRGV